MNTKAFLLFVSLVATVFCLLSCGDCSKKVDCPAYNDTVLNNLFPYTSNQQLNFKASTGETVLFTVRNTETTQPYQATGGALGPSPSCETKKVFESDEKDAANRKLFALTLNGATSFHYAFLTMGKDQISFTAQTDTGFYNISLNGFYAPPLRQPSITIGNRVFANVTSATRDTTTGKVSGIYKIYYTKTEGIVGYSEYPSLKTWVKQ